jgi:hypothetical protein
MISASSTCCAAPAANSILTRSRGNAEYRITLVTGDAMLGSGSAATWRETGITYQQSELVKSEILSRRRG